MAGLVSFGVKGFNWGIDFKGGTSWEIPAHGATVSEVQNAVANVGVAGATVQGLGHGSSATIQVQADLTKESASQQAANKTDVTDALARIGHISANDVSLTDVGPTWGSQISDKAVIAVLVFFVVVVVYISFRFEWKMAMAALIAVIHDLLVTAGIYSLAGFQVTPDTVIALLTILGYSLYDTVVVFDRVKENGRGQFSTGRMTYEDIVNLSMNQTLARSIQYLARGNHARPGGARHRCTTPRSHDAAVLRAGARHRAHVGGLLVDLHRVTRAVGVQRA